MPVHCSSGACKWGHRGKAYKVSTYGRAGARERAARQGRAAYANGYRGRR